MNREPKQRQLAWQNLDDAAHVLRHPGFRILAQIGSLKLSKHKYDINKYKRVSFTDRAILLTSTCERPAPLPGTF
jgi:hypothetical protein